MAMPQPGTEWPPQAYVPAMEQVRSDAAWLTNDTHLINPPAQSRGVTSPLQHNGGLAGMGARMVLGRPQPQPGSASVPRSLPIAPSLCGVSANVMAGDPPAVTLHPDDEKNVEAAQALDDLTSSDMFAAELHQAMKKCSGMGWVFPRLVWNADVQQHPWIEWVDADRAIAERRNGRLVSVLFWDEYRKGNRGQTVYRLMQEHTPGRIDYALFVGTRDTVGHQVPVTELAETEHLAKVIDQDGGIDTGTELLTAAQMINGETNPQWRNDPQLRYYGLSDVQKAGGLWEDINATWTNLKHEEDAGRSRLMVTEELLDTGEPGMGQFFDWFRDVFPIGAGGDPDAAGVIKPIQFDIRADKYIMILAQQLSQAARAVGLSAITVGAEQASAQMTATEIKARSTLTISTAKAKGRYVRSELSEIITAYLCLDAALNSYEPPTRLVNVSLPEVVQETELDRTNAVLNLRQARAASTRYLVRRLHPEWTKQEVDEEVAAIMAEEAMSNPVDPFSIGADQPFDDTGDEEEA